MDRLGGSRPRDLGCAGICGDQRRPAGRRHRRRGRRTVLRPGAPRLPRPHRVGRHAAVEQRPGGPAGGLLSGDQPVRGGGNPSAAPGGHLPVGGFQRPVPRSCLPRRGPRGRLHRHVERADRPHDQDDPEVATAVGRPARTRRLVRRPHPGSGTHRGPDAGVRQFLRPQPAHPGILRSLPPGSVSAALALHPPRRQMGPFLLTRGRRGPDRVLRQLPQGRGQRLGEHRTGTGGHPRRRPRPGRRGRRTRLAAARPGLDHLVPRPARRRSERGACRCGRPDRVRPAVRRADDGLARAAGLRRHRARRATAVGRPGGRRGRAPVRRAAQVPR